MSIESKKAKARNLINTIKTLDTKEKYLGFVVGLTTKLDFSKGTSTVNYEVRTIITLMLHATIEVGNYNAAAASAADQVEEMYNGLFELMEREATERPSILDVILHALEAAEKADQHKHKPKF